MFKKIVLGLVLILLIFLKYALAFTEEELKFGFYADRSIAASYTILFDDALTKRISEIGNRIVKASGESNMNYTFRVINDPTINAYSTAGGFVYVNTGLLDILESEDELAAVLAHEIGHIRNHHQIKFLYFAYRKAVEGQLIGAFIGAALAVAGTAAMGPAPSPYSPSYNMYQMYVQQINDLAFQMGGIIGNTVAVSMIKGYGKEQELEADKCAVQYTYKAGYDPYALIRVFKKLKLIKDRLEYRERTRFASFVNAEPGLDARIKHAEALISKLVKNSH